MAGRKTKFTDDKAAQIVNLLSGGATIKDACAYVGIDPSTLDNWCAKYSDFSESVNKARATGKIECIALVRQAARNNWQAAAWFLERSDPTNWGRRDKLILQHDLDPAQINQWAAQLEQAGYTPGEALERLVNELISSATNADTSGGEGG